MKSLFFSAIISKALKSSLFDIFRRRLELKAWSPYKSYGSQPYVYKQVFKAFHVCLGLHIVLMIAAIHISQEIFAIDMLTAVKTLFKRRSISQACCEIDKTIWKPDLNRVAQENKPCIHIFICIFRWSV